MDTNIQGKKNLCQEISHIIATIIKNSAISGVIKNGSLENSMEEIISNLSRAGHEMYRCNVDPDCYETWKYDDISEKNFGLTIEVDIQEGSTVSWKNSDETWVRLHRNKSNKIKAFNETDDPDYGRKEKLRWFEKPLSYFTTNSKGL